VDRDREDIVGDVRVRVLVEVVADTGSVSEEVLDGHVVASAVRSPRSTRTTPENPVSAAS